METVYRSHFVEKGVGSLQNGAPQPHPGNGNRDSNRCAVFCPSYSIYDDDAAAAGGGGGEGEEEEEEEEEGRRRRRRRRRRRQISSS